MTDKQIDQILKKCAEAINENRDLRRKCERLQAKNADLKRTNKAIQKQAEKKIAECYRVLFKPLKRIERNYGVEVENDD